MKDGLTVEIIGDKKAQSRLARAAQKFRRTKPLFDRITIYLEQSTAKTFKMEGRPKKWPQSHRAAEESGQTLRDKNQLFMSVTGKGKGAIRQTTRRGLVFGTSLIHGAVHHFGSPELGLPERPILGIYKEDEKAIDKIMKDWGKEVTGASV